MPLLFPESIVTYSVHFATVCTFGERRISAHDLLIQTFASHEAGGRIVVQEGDSDVLSFIEAPDGGTWRESLSGLASIAFTGKRRSGDQEWRRRRRFVVRLFSFLHKRLQPSARLLCAILFATGEPDGPSAPLAALHIICPHTLL